MPDQSSSFVDMALSSLYRHWPSLLGAIVALNWQPAESSWRSRAFSGFSAVALSAMFAAPLAELLRVESATLQSGIAGCLSLFGLIVASQIAQALSGLGPLLVQRIRRWLGV